MGATRLMAAAVSVLATAVVGIACSSGGGRQTVKAADGTSTTAAAACPAASLVVHGVRGERLHPDWLPAGFVLTNGDENALGPRGQLTYANPKGDLNRRVELLRYHTSMPTESLTASGVPRAVTVQGKPGLAKSEPPTSRPNGPAPPVLRFDSVAWVDSPGTTLLVSGANVDAATVMQIAQHLSYDAGTSFVYPAQPATPVTRTQALATVPGATAARLSSFGEVNALLRPPGSVNSTATIALAGTAPAVEQPVWLVSTHPPGSASGGTATVIDAVTGARVATVDGASAAAVDAVTDRSQPGCNPPFGVLTRSEVSYVPAGRAITTLKLVTLGAFAATRTGMELAQCASSACPPDVPVWVLLTTATDHSLAQGLGRAPLAPSPVSTTAPPEGSYQLYGRDARTGAQETEVSWGTSSGPGAPPADIVALADLAPD